jgi:UDP-N-acetylglucosamine 2-epimerase
MVSNTIVIEIHRAKKIVEHVNELATLVNNLAIEQDMKNILFVHINEIKSLLEKARIKEDKNAKFIC